MQTEEDVYTELKKTFHYDPATGLFTRLFDSGTSKAGSIAGESKQNNSYILIRLGKRLYSAHRLVFLYMTGSWPLGVVDHKDLEKNNNRWDNLRDVSEFTNKRNVPLRKENTSGYAGINWCTITKKWHVTIHADGKLNSIGRFSDKDLAISARIEAENKYWQPLDRIWDKL